MIKSVNDMTIKKEKISPMYRVVIVLAIYHLIIIAGFALTSFVMMENKFVNISFLDWPIVGRFFYVFGYFALLPFMLLPFMFDLSAEESKS